METAKLFEMYQRAVRLEQAALELYKRRVELLSASDPRTQQAADRYTRRERQRDKLAARITDDLAASGWTFITNDPATLPPASTSVSLAYETTGGKRRTTSAFIHIYKNGSIRWHIINSKAFLPPWWKPYAWQPLPTAPPLPGERGE